MKKIIVKSNDLNSVSLFNKTAQIKIFSMLIVEVRKAPEKEFYGIPIKDIFTSLNLSKNYHYIKNVCNDMMRCIDMSDDDKKIIRLRSLFIDINTEGKEGIITFEINKKLKSHFVNQKSNFTSYFLKNIVNLRTFYAIRLYEILKQYEATGWLKISLSDLKTKIGLKGAYPRYNNFKIKVLVKAQKEICDKADICFTFEEIKEGKRVVKIIFNISKNYNPYEQFMETKIYEIFAVHMRLDDIYIKDLYDKYNITDLEHAVQKIRKKVASTGLKFNEVKQILENILSGEKII